MPHDHVLLAEKVGNSAHVYSEYAHAHGHTRCATERHLNFDLFGSAKADPVRFKWGFGEGLLKDKFALFEAYKNRIPKRRELLAKRPF